MREYAMMNEDRIKELIRKYGFSFSDVSKFEIRELIEKEIDDFQRGSAEYIRMLCGYLYCIGDPADAVLIEKVKYGISMDVGCMIDSEWIDSLKGIQNEYIRDRAEIVQCFVDYYKDYE